jgi:hypothetical protein
MIILHNDSYEPRPAVASGALTLLHMSTVARAPLRMLTLSAAKDAYPIPYARRLEQVDSRRSEAPTAA